MKLTRTYRPSMKWHGIKLIEAISANAIRGCLKMHPDPGNLSDMEPIGLDFN